VTTYNLEV